jgi:regulator of protease activity HflC (stomatin/prohibitin superfamily)
MAETFTMPQVPKIIVPLILAVVVILVLAANATYSVNYGSVAIVTRFGKIVGDPINPGLHFKIPFVDNVVTYKTQKLIYETVDTSVYNQNQNYNSDVFSRTNGIKAQESGYQDVAIDTTTKDGQQISVRYTVRFSINPAKIEDIANTIGTEIDVVDKIVKTESRIWARNVPRNYPALDLYTGNIEQVSQEIKDKLTPIFEANGLIMDEFGIRSINFQEEYVNTIEQKQIEKEKIATEEYIAKQEEFKKLAAITKAQGDAEGQRLQQQTLTADLIKKMWVEKWNGQLPTTMAGDSNGIMLNLK